MTQITLDKNDLEGPIPPSLGNLSQLNILGLSYNKFRGNIPSSLGNLNQLVILDLSYNKLQGNITLEVSNLQQLTELYLSSNKLTDHIPDILGQCQNLKIVELDLNLLTGSIPISLSNLKTLSMLNLSHNNLSGTIPTALENLQFLTQLDLSYNNLKGKVPTKGVFTNSTAISLISNWGLCGGSPDLHLPPCCIVSPRKEIQYYLVRLLILVFGLASIILLFHFLLPVETVSRGKLLLMVSFGKQFPKVSYRDLARATLNFSEANLVGRGSYGSVYKGKIVQAKMQVAIKVFDLEMRCAGKSFTS